MVWEFRFPDLKGIKPKLVHECVRDNKILISTFESKSSTRTVDRGLRQLVGFSKSQINLHFNKHIRLKLKWVNVDVC